MCRGGDCGSRRKHPQVDHVAQLARIRQELQGEHATVSVSKCLDQCELSNVMVVLPGRTARDAGVEPLWVGRVLDDGTTEAVVACARSIGRAGEPPAAIATHRFVPTRPGSIRRTGRAR